MVDSADASALSSPTSSLNISTPSNAPSASTGQKRKRSSTMDELIKVARENQQMTQKYQQMTQEYQRNMFSLMKVLTQCLQRRMGQLAPTGVPYSEATPATAPSSRPP